MDYRKVGLGLGLFSIGLGLAELAAPGRIARVLGLGGSSAAKTTLRAFGAREVLAGAMLLKGPAVSTNAWNRVAGDAMDAAALGLAFRRSRNPQAMIGALAFVGSALALDVWAALGLARQTGSTFPDLVQSRSSPKAAPSTA